MHVRFRVRVCVCLCVCSSRVPIRARVPVGDGAGVPAAASHRRRALHPGDPRRRARGRFLVASPRKLLIATALPVEAGAPRGLKGRLPRFERGGAASSIPSFYPGTRRAGCLGLPSTGGHTHARSRQCFLRSAGGFLRASSERLRRGSPPRKSPEFVLQGQGKDAWGRVYAHCGGAPFPALRPPSTAPAHARAPRAPHVAQRGPRPQPQGVPARGARRGNV